MNETEGRVALAKKARGVPSIPPRSRLSRRIISSIHRGFGFHASKHSGYTEFSPITKEVKLYGNTIARVGGLQNKRGLVWNTGIEWIDLCWYPTRTTLSRLKILGLDLYKNKGEVFIRILDKDILVPPRGIVPVEQLLRTIGSRISEEEAGNIAIPGVRYLPDLYPHHIEQWYVVQISQNSNYCSIPGLPSYYMDKSDIPAVYHYYLRILIKESWLRPRLKPY